MARKLDRIDPVTGATRAHLDFTLFAILLRPKSEGYVSLSSKDPLATPIIHSNYLGDPLGIGSFTSIYLYFSPIKTIRFWMGILRTWSSIGFCGRITENRSKLFYSVPYSWPFDTWMYLNELKGEGASRSSHFVFNFAISNSQIESQISGSHFEFSG